MNTQIIRAGAGENSKTSKNWCGERKTCPSSSTGEGSPPTPKND